MMKRSSVSELFFYIDYPTQDKLIAFKEAKVIEMLYILFEITLRVEAKRMLRTHILLTLYDKRGSLRIIHVEQ